MVPLVLHFASLLIATAFAQEVNQTDTEIQSCKVCGYGGKSIEGSEMVVNGETVDEINKYPWIVSINKVNKSKVFCSGALISSQFVLTAAHCLENDEEEDCGGSECFLDAASIEIGVWHDTDAEGPAKTLEVAEVIPRRDYGPENGTEGVLMSDIGLIKLSEEVECSDEFGPICLYDQKETEVSEYLHLAGWGRSSTKGKKKDEKQKLREGTIKIIPSKKCSHSEEDSEASDTIICAQAGDSEQSICKGDSGSSIFSKIKGAFYSLGVTSVLKKDKSDTNHQCSLKNKAKFTRVYSYLQWIQEYVKELPKPREPAGEDS